MRSLPPLLDRLFGKLKGALWRVATCEGGGGGGRE